MDGFLVAALTLLGVVLLIPLLIGLGIGYAWGVRRERRRQPHHTTESRPESVARPEEAEPAAEAFQGWASPAGPAMASPGGVGLASSEDAGTGAQPAVVPGTAPGAIPNTPVTSRFKQPSPPPTAPDSGPPAGYSAPYAPVIAAPKAHTSGTTGRSPGREAVGINIALYMGGLVLTGAALSFVAIARVPEVTAVSLIIAYLASAVLGFWLATKVPVLKPAGLAIFGTSLALLAVLAVPLNEAFIGDGVSTWLIVSLTGVIIYGVAAVHLDSAVLGYLVIPFLYSSVFSSTAVIQQPLVWTFSGILLIVTLIQWAAFRWPDRVPQVFRRPFGQLHPWVAPGVIMAALLSVWVMTSGDYAILFAVAGAYYVVSAITAQHAVSRIISAFAARLLLTLALVCALVFAEAGIDVIFALVALWVAALTVAVWEMPWTSGVTLNQPRGLPHTARGHGMAPLLRVRRWDRRLMWVVLVLGLVGLQGLYRPGGVMAVSGLSAHPWFLGYAGVLIAATVYALWRDGHDRSVHRWVVRTAVIYLVWILWFAFPAYAAGYLALWMMAEYWLATSSSRLPWQRGLTVATAAMVAWTLGDAIADFTAASRGALTVMILSAITVIGYLFKTRVTEAGRSPRAVTTEALTYWLITVVSLLAGVHVFGATEWWAYGYLMTAILVCYVLLVALARMGVSVGPPASGPPQSLLLPAVRAATFAAAVLFTAASLVGEAGIVRDLFAVDAASAVRLFLVAATVFAAEIITGVVVGRRSTQRSVATHGWVPAQLSANAAWLTGVNAVIHLWTVDVPLWWFTATAWACTSAWYYRAASTAPRTAATYLTVARLYGTGMVLILAAAMVIPPHVIAVYAVGAGAILVALALVRWAVSHPETAVAGAVLTASAVALVVGSTLADSFSGGVWGSPGVVGYITAPVAFLAVAGYAWWCVRRIRARKVPPPQRALCIAVTLGTLAVISLAPIPGAVHGELPLLAWVVPGMHAATFSVATLFPRWRAVVGVIAPVVMPLSALFAWSMAVDVGERAAAATALVILLAYVLTEVGLFHRAGLTWGEAGQKMWAASLYICATVAAASLGVMALGSQDPLLRAAPLAAGACLLLAGVWRKRRTGVFAGAAIIAISILWALRGVMFLFLVALGLIIMGAAVWRLVTVQKRQRSASSTSGVPLKSPHQ